MTLEITPQAAPPPPAAAERRFRRLLDRARTARRPLIQLQHNPDPDALASGQAVRHILKRVLRVDPVVAFTGSVGRAENRAMMRYLRIQILPAFKVNYGHHDLVVVVDTHPGAGTCRLPDAVPVDVVFDHHPQDPSEAHANGSAKGRPRLDLSDAAYGATSTLVGEMILANGMAVPKSLATALCYGIQTDTLDLARNVSPADERVFAALYALADKKLLGRIQRARVPQSWYVSLERGLRRGQVHDVAVTSHLGPVEHPDFVAEMADLLFRLEGMQWSFVTGLHGRVLYASIRAMESDGVDAGAIARAVAGAKGSGGGHESLAAAQIPVPASADPEALAAAALEEFLSAIRAKKSLTRPLTLPPEASPAGEAG
jgi:nanoRNase/pAp phosphatase (c-di-AMP/oligoRNAs hydrolase)